MILLEKTLIEEIARIGELRRPNEACGILLPEPWRGKQVWEIPNRSPHPTDSFVMKGEDVLLTIEDWVSGENGDWSKIAVWHTHPGGNLGPSRDDMKQRSAELANLVITLYEDGEPKATWY